MVGTVDEFIQRRDDKSRPVGTAKAAKRVLHVILKAGHLRSTSFPG